MTNEIPSLHREMDAARLLREQLAALIAGDEAVAADFVEGETNLQEAITAACALYAADKCHIEAIDAHIALIETRKIRLKKRQEMTKALLATAFDLAGKKTVETALGTATLKNTPRNLVLDPDLESEIPLDYWKRPDPVLDRNKLKADLKAGRTISGARLDNGGVAISFSFR